MVRELYICTKPLQYFNVKNIGECISGSYKILLVKNVFNGADRFTEKVRREDTLWDEVIFADGSFEYMKAVVKARAGRLYIDNDSSGFYALYAQLFFKTVFVYEEGFGTYRSAAIRESVGKYKYGLYRLLGIDKRIGNARYLRGIYVYLPGLYKRLFPEYKKEIHVFRRPFTEALQRNASFLFSLADGCPEIDGVTGCSVLIYLTSHRINERVLHEVEAIRGEYDRIYVKPHPHIKRIELPEVVKGQVIRSNMMVELLLLRLLENGNRITVIHENSTSVIWFQDRVRCINRGDYLETYEQVAGYIREHADEIAASFEGGADDGKGCEGQSKREF